MSKSQDTVQKINIGYLSHGMPHIKGIGKIIENEVKVEHQAIKNLLDEREKQIFGEKVTDGTLRKLADVDEIPLRNKEVVFCSAKTRDRILSSVFVPYLKIFISNAIQDDNVYLLTDETLKRRIFEKEYEKEKHADRVALLARLEEHNSNMYGVELSNADRILCIEALKRQIESEGYNE